MNTQTKKWQSVMSGVGIVVVILVGLLLIFYVIPNYYSVKQQLRHNNITAVENMATVLANMTLAANAQANSARLKGAGVVNMGSQREVKMNNSLVPAASADGIGKLVVLGDFDVKYVTDPLHQAIFSYRQLPHCAVTYDTGANGEGRTKITMITDGC